LRQEDERKQAEQVDAWVKNLGPKGADIIKSGVLTIPRVYTLLLSRSDPVSSPLGQDPLMIIVKVNSRTPFLKENPELYFQENEWFRSNEVKSLSKLVHVSYGGRDFAQGDFKFKENRKDHFARVLATCEKEYYLVFQFVGSNAADVELVSEVAKSIRFDATAKEKR